MAAADTVELGAGGRVGRLGGGWVARGETGVAAGIPGVRARGPLGGFPDERTFATRAGVALRGAFVVANTFVRRTFVTPGVTLATIKR